MKIIIKKMKNKYFLFSFVTVMLCVICLASYGVFIVTTSKYRASEMYFGKLLYQIVLESKSDSASVDGKIVTLTADNATSTIFMKVISLNPVKSRYNIEYSVTSGNVSVRYSSVTGWLPQGYLDGTNGTVYEKIIKIKIINASETAATVALDVVGGYAYNSDLDVETLSGYNKLINNNSSSIFNDSSAPSVKVLSERVKNDTNCIPTSSSPCIYGGEINSNRVMYSGDLYRIIGVYLIDGIESVKLVKETNYEIITSYNNYQTSLETWEDYLYSPIDYQKMSSPFCTTDALSCSSPELNYGLITKKEYESMGMHYSYLNDGTNSLTITENGNDVYYIKYDGTVGTIAKESSLNVKPVFYLQEGVKVLKTTDGTSASPYQFAPRGDLFINSIRINNQISSSTPTAGNYMMTADCTCDQETCDSDTMVLWDNDNYTMKISLDNSSPTLSCDVNFYEITTITLDNQGAVSNSSIISTYAQALPTVTPPSSSGCVFGGYYSGISGSGVKYINNNGIGLATSSFDEDTTLYAKWTCTQTFRNNKTIINSGSLDNSSSLSDWVLNQGSGSFVYNSNFNGYSSYVITSTSFNKTSSIYQSFLDSYEPNTQYLVSLKVYISSDYVAGTTNNYTRILVSGHYNNSGTSTSWTPTYSTTELGVGRNFESLARNRWVDMSILFTTPAHAKSLVTDANFYLYFRDWTGTIAFRDLNVSKYDDVQTKTSVLGTIVGSLPTINQSGYVFRGWYTQSIGGTKITSSTNSGLATNYYAQWIKAVLLSDAIKRDNSEYTTQVVLNYDMFQNAATTDQGLWTENRTGKTEDNLPVYFYRGDIDNNYVSFANKMWRIVRINEDGSVKLILGGNSTTDGYGGTRTTFNPNDDSTAYLDYNHANNALKSANNSWYASNLSSYETYIADTKFCNDKSGSTWTYGARIRLIDSSTKAPQYKCPNASDNYEYKIGALTADEVAYAGGLFETDNSSYYLYDNAQSSGSNGVWWTLSPSFYNGSNSIVLRVYGSNYPGKLANYYVSSEFGFRPVISLKSDTLILRGDGTYLSPYVITE